MTKRCYTIDMEKVSMGKKLETLRKESRLTQQQLAERTGLAQSSICQWERDRALPTCDALVQLCRFYDVSADFLLGEMSERGEYPVVYKDVTPEQQMYIQMLSKLNRRQKQVVFDMMRELIE